jgi:hypothetical protein
MICTSCSYTLVREKADNGKWYWQRYYKNAQKRERWYAKQIFHYTKDTTYERYKGKMIADSACDHTLYIRFDSLGVILDRKSFRYKDIFLDGLLSPQAIYFGNNNFIMDSLTRLKTDQESTDAEWCHLKGHNMFVEIKEFRHLTLGPKKRGFELRYHFWPDRNPVIMFFEITDPHAKMRTPLNQFIKDGKVSFLKYMWFEV